MALLETLRNWWPIILFVFQTLVAAGLWIIRRSLATKSDLDRVGDEMKQLVTDVDDRVDEAVGRVVRLEHWRSVSPKPQEVANMRLNIESLRGELQTTNSRIEAMGQRMGSEFHATRQSIEAVERLLGIINEHLIATPRN